MDWIGTNVRPQAGCECPSGFEGSRRYVSRDAVLVTPRLGRRKLPFGMHRGERIADVPRDYLEWVISNVTGFEDIKRAICIFLGLLPAKRAKLAPKQKQSGRPVCRKCECRDVAATPQRFADGTRHVRLSCRACGAFIKWQSKTDRRK